MEKFKKIGTDIPGLFVIEPKVHKDPRGFFLEFYVKREFERFGLTAEFVQDNHSRSMKGVLRGLHFQTRHAQGKLVRVTRGAVWDVAVDIRKGSPTYGRHYGVELTEDNKRLFYIPVGFAHGFLTLSEVAELQYKVTDYYDAESDAGIIWNDEDLGIPWPFEKGEISEPQLSKKDKNLPRLRDYDSPFRFDPKASD